jgi:hypothetical protein
LSFFKRERFWNEREEETRPHTETSTKLRLRFFNWSSSALPIVCPSPIVIVFFWFPSNINTKHLGGTLGTIGTGFSWTRLPKISWARGEWASRILAIAEIPKEKKIEQQASELKGKWVEEVESGEREVAGPEYKETWRKH